LPEVGGDAVAYTDPYDVREISAQIETLLRSPELRSDLATRARARSKQFSWERFAQITVEVLERTADAAR
jgi:glycosyltransferase involved in cell wall biosynthesis